MTDEPAKMKHLDVRIDVDAIRAAIPPEQQPADVRVQIFSSPDERYPNPQPGTPCRLLVTKEFRDPTDPRNAAPLKGQPGLYRVTLLLRAPESSEMAEGEYGSPDAQFGCSGIRVLEPEAKDNYQQWGLKFRVPVGTGHVDCAGYLNADGYLGKIVVHRLDAASYEDAFKKAESVISAWLSHVSLLHEVPVEIAASHVGELSTGNQILQFRTPAAEISFKSVGIPPTDNELALYASFYREGLNSRAPLYQFLCFFKIIEGLEVRRNRLDAPIIAKGGTPKRERSWLPKDANEARTWLEEIYPGREWMDETLAVLFPPVMRGIRLNKAIKAHLQPIRVRIAHAFLDSGEPGLSVDEITRVADVEQLVPITKFIARFMLKKEFPDYFAQLVRVQEGVEFVPAESLSPRDGIAESPPFSGIRFAVKKLD